MKWYVRRLPPYVPPCILPVPYPLSNKQTVTIDTCMVGLDGAWAWSASEGGKSQGSMQWHTLKT